LVRTLAFCRVPRKLWAFGFEPKGRTFDEIDSRHDALAPAVATAARASAE